MGTAREQLLSITTLTPPQSAKDMFLNVSTGAEHLFGDIILNPDKWANIAIPVEGKKVKEYLLDWIANETGHPAEDSVTVVKAFPATDTQSGSYLTFVPGVTNPASSSNFELVVTDNGKKEITGFLIKMKDYTGFYSGDLVFHWDTED